MTEIFDNIDRIRTEFGGDPVRGRVVWSPVKSLFLIACYAGTLAGLIFWLRIDTVLLFLAKTAVVLLLGHSVGMHRRLIHKSFDCPLWLERFLVYMGVLVGLGGPFAMIRTHDFRDWAQRQTHCHDYFAHRRALVIDGLWQMHCDIRLDQPPHLVIEDEVATDPFYRFIDRHWIAVHLQWVLLFLAIGGWSWVAWGVCAQVAATVTGHWFIGYFAHHDDGHPIDHWHVNGAGVQGRDVALSGLITMGEGWHNNHHAFPGSARLGLHPGQSDPGFWFLKALEGLGLVWNIRVPAVPRPQVVWQGAAPKPQMSPDRKPCPSMLRLGRLWRRAMA